MGYEGALEAAGAVVLEFKNFGSYQENWYALVNFEGNRGFVSGSYGSCSGCDAFESELVELYEQCDEHKYVDVSEVKNCAPCRRARENYQVQFKAFGGRYLEGGLLTLEEAVKRASENLEWDCDAQEMVGWVKETFARHLEV